ncbi:hypothetical protein HZY86_07775 [Aerococcaceae bacterium DSM 111020]|nr:hypothetical protein [Aerococcaceae bacterium DSM 111020]
MGIQTSKRMEIVKKWLSTILIILVSFSLVGCGNNEVTAEEKAEYIQTLKDDTFKSIAGVDLIETDSDSEDRGTINIYYCDPSMKDRVDKALYSGDWDRWDTLLKEWEEFSSDVQSKIGKGYTVVYWYPTLGASTEIMVHARDGNIIYDALRD